MKEQGEESAPSATKYVLLVEVDPPHRPVRVQHTPNPLAQVPEAVPPGEEKEK